MLNRRTMFGAVALAGPVAGTIAVEAAPPRSNGRRISCVKGDPGERFFAELCGDEKTAKVMLDGVEQKMVETADEAEGFVIRLVETPGGNIAWNRATGEILRETVRGRVEIIDT